MSRGVELTDVGDSAARLSRSPAFCTQGVVNATVIAYQVVWRHSRHDRCAIERGLC